MQKLKTAKEISDVLNLGQQRIYELTRRGLIPHVRIGHRQYRYVESEIEEWLRKGGNNNDKGDENDPPFRAISSQNSEDVR